MESRLAAEYFTADGKFYSEGEVLESSPPNKLSYTWPESEAEKTAVVPERGLWEITPSGPGTVKLKLIHDRLTDKYYEAVGEGWPLILSSLKSLLETGAPLAFDKKEHERGRHLQRRRVEDGRVRAGED